MERVGGLTTIPVMVNLPGLAGSPAAGRCLVMGVVNVTPDSFSDGGQWFDAAAAVEHGLELIAQGADIVDVGGESTRPGAQRVPVDEELRRVKPVITELVRAGAVVSVDTMRAQVAEWAVEVGVSLVNDVSGGLADPYMPRLVGKAGIPYVVVHWRGHSHDMNSRAIYADVVREVHDELAQRVGMYSPLVGGRFSASSWSSTVADTTAEGKSYSHPAASQDPIFSRIGSELGRFDAMSIGRWRIQRRCRVNFHRNIAKYEEFQRRRRTICTHNRTDRRGVVASRNSQPRDIHDLSRHATRDTRPAPCTSPQLRYAH